MAKEKLHGFTKKGAQRIVRHVRQDGSKPHDAARTVNKRRSSVDPPNRVGIIYGGVLPAGTTTVAGKGQIKWQQIKDSDETYKERTNVDPAECYNTGPEVAEGEPVIANWVFDKYGADERPLGHWVVGIGEGDDVKGWWGCQDTATAHAVSPGDASVNETLSWKFETNDTTRFGGAGASTSYVELILAGWYELTIHITGNAADVTSDSFTASPNLTADELFTSMLQYQLGVEIQAAPEAEAPVYANLECGRTAMSFFLFGAGAAPLDSGECSKSVLYEAAAGDRIQITLDGDTINASTRTNVVLQTTESDFRILYRGTTMA